MDGLLSPPQTLGLRHSSDVVGVPSEPSSSGPAASPSSDAAYHSAFLPALDIAPVRLARERLSMDKHILPPAKSFVHRTSRLSIAQWNDRLRALRREGAPHAEVLSLAQEMHRMNVRMDETTVELLVGELDFRAPAGGEAGGDSELLSLGSALYVLPEDSLPLSFEKGTTRVRQQQRKIQTVQDNFARLQAAHTSLSAKLAAEVKRNPPTMPHHFEAPFPELDAFQSDLKVHYDEWTALVPQYEAAVTAKAADVAARQADVREAQDVLRDAVQRGEPELDIATLRANLQTANDVLKQTREAHATSKEHAKSAVAFRDNFKPRSLARLPEFIPVEGYATPGYEAFVKAYQQRVASLPKDNRAAWRDRLARHRTQLRKLAEDERALADASADVVLAQEAIAEARATTDLSKVDYEALAPAGRAEFDHMREAQQVGHAQVERERALVARLASEYPAQARHAEALLVQLSEIEDVTVNQLGLGGWGSAARRLAAARASPDASLAADWLGAFVASFQLYSAWLARHGDGRTGTDVSVVTLEALAAVVKTTPAYPPALQVANDIFGRLLSAQNGAGVRAVRENVKHLDATTASDFEPLAPLAVRHAPIHRLLNALAAIVNDARPKAGVAPNVLAQMDDVRQTVCSQLDGLEKGLFNLEDYAELSQPKKTEGALMRESVERVAQAYEARIAKLRRG